MFDSRYPDIYEFPTVEILVSFLKGHREDLAQLKGLRRGSKMWGFESDPQRYVVDMETVERTHPRAMRDPMGVLRDMIESEMFENDVPIWHFSIRDSLRHLRESASKAEIRNYDDPERLLEDLRGIQGQKTLSVWHPPKGMGLLVEQEGSRPVWNLIPFQTGRGSRLLLSPHLAERMSRERNYETLDDMMIDLLKHVKTTKVGVHYLDWDSERLGFFAHPFTFRVPSSRVPRGCSLVDSSKKRVAFAEWLTRTHGDGRYPESFPWSRRDAHWFYMWRRRAFLRTTPKRLSPEAEAERRPFPPDVLVSGISNRDGIESREGRGARTFRAKSSEDQTESCHTTPTRF